MNEANNTATSASNVRRAPDISSDREPLPLVSVIMMCMRLLIRP